MSKLTLEYKEKHHVLEVDGVEYEVPQRTQAFEEKLREHDKNLRKMTEYQANYSLLELFFGKDAAKKMFPDKENTNLDKLALATRYAVSLYMAEFTVMNSEEK